MSNRLLPFASAALLALAAQAKEKPAPHPAPGAAKGVDSGIRKGVANLKKEAKTNKLIKNATQGLH